MGQGDRHDRGKPPKESGDVEVIQPWPEDKRPEPKDEKKGK